VPAILAGARGDRARGYVRVDEDGRGKDHRLLAEVVIPDAKRPTYDLCRTLLDNYRLDQTKPEDTSQAEARELLALLEAVTDRPPMAEARALIGRLQGRTLSRDAWQELIFDIWFRPFDDGRNRDLSGFEHVVVGEQKAGTVNGYHFWYRYYLDDWGLLGTGDDIDFDGTRYDRRLIAAGRADPDMATLAWRWHAQDHDTGAERTIFKPAGSFWIGCSVEGLMALGMARFVQPDPGAVTINRARYAIELYKSPDRRSLRSYFPRYLGPA
jgi:hypothetical protein